MSRIKKGELQEVKGSIHKSKELPDDLISFSFRHLKNTDKFSTALAEDPGNYLACLMDRLQSVSDIKVSDFRACKNKSLRAHTHDWSKTTEPNGFRELNEQLQGCEAWQFQISANEHGRVHGLLIDQIFYVVWLDPCHALYE